MIHYFENENLSLLFYILYSPSSSNDQNVNFNSTSTNTSSTLSENEIRLKYFEKENLNYLKRWIISSAGAGAGAGDNSTSDSIVKDNEIYPNINELKRIKDKNQLFKFIINNLKLFNKNINDIIEILKM